MSELYRAILHQAPIQEQTKDHMASDHTQNPWYQIWRPFLGEDQPFSLTRSEVHLRNILARVERLQAFKFQRTMKLVQAKG